MKTYQGLIRLMLFFITPLVFSQNQDNTSIAMLNHLTTEVRLIIHSSNNRLVLEDVYNRMVNAIDLDAVVVDDYETQEYLRDIRTELQKLRLVTLQRERLQFILENKRSQAMWKSLPNPLYVIGAINFSDLAIGVVNPGFAAKRFAMKILANTGAMALDSVARYRNEINAGNMEFLTENWALDDKEKESLYSLRDNTVDHMINLVRANKVRGYETLNEDSIDDFVKNKSQQNQRRYREFLESAQAKTTYTKYAPYWLELAEMYYDLASENNDNPEQYRKSLEALKEYENVQARIFRKDYAYAGIIPKMILAASVVYGNDRAAYIRFADDYLERLIKNSDEKQSTLRFFAAQTYISLAEGERKESRLRTAYSLLMDNTRLLSEEHEKALEEYYNPAGDIPGSLTKNLADAQQELTYAKIKKESQGFFSSARSLADKEVQKAGEKIKAIEKQIKQFREYRKRELPPFSHSLWINYMTARHVMNELDVPAENWQGLYELIGDAFFQLDMMEVYWEITKPQPLFHDLLSNYKNAAEKLKLRNLKEPQLLIEGIRDLDITSWAMKQLGVIYATSGTFDFQDFFGNYFFGNYTMKCPDVILTAVNSIDMRLYENEPEQVLWQEENVEWEVSSIDREAFTNPRLALAEIKLNIKSGFKVEKNKSYILEIYIRNIDEEGSYNNRLHFENPAGQNKWSFKYVEQG